MDSLERQLIHQLVADHLRAEAPEALPALEPELDATLEAMPPRPRGAGGEHPGGLPFDVPQVAWTLVSAAIWISSCFLTEAVRHRRERSREKALDRLEVLLAEQVLDPLLVHGLRRRVEELLEKTGDLAALLSASSTRPGGGAAVRGEGAGAALPSPAARGPAPSAPPDLEIVIRREWRDGRESLRFELSAANLDLGIDHETFHSQPFEQAPATHVGELLRGIGNLPPPGKDPRAAVDRLSAICAGLTAHLLTPELEARLCSLRGKVETVQIQSEETFIPWEMLKLRCREGSGRRDEPFLCEAFAVARWLLGGPRRTTCLPLRQVATVVARDGNVGRATPEIEALLRQANPERVVEGVPALTAPLLDALASGRYDGWYFAVHGEAKGDDPEGWELRLEQHQAFAPCVLEDRAAGLGDARPLVFLNSCHSGRSGLALTGTGGWSSGFVRAGAGVFLGCYWAVDDQKAHELALEFYRRLLAEGLPLAGALRQARLWLRARYPGDPTWLAYTLFGHPGAGVNTL